MTDFLSLSDLCKLSMTNSADRELFNNSLSNVSFAGIDTFIHRTFTSANFVMWKDFHVPKDRIRPRSDAYYAGIEKSYADAVIAYEGFIREYGAVSTE